MEPKIAMEVEKIIQEEGIADRVVVLSPKQLPQSGEGGDLLPDLMRTSKVFLTMSEMEGFGMAACEAAACAVPVVGTDLIPVLTDVIEPAGGGISVRAGDTEGAAAALLKILRMDERTYAEMSKRAFDSVIPKFTWHSITKGMFDQVKANGHGGAGKR
jgi:glycosyltransferase involved in cell wall biosynthesis